MIKKLIVIIHFSGERSKRSSVYFVVHVIFVETFSIF